MSKGILIIAGIAIILVVSFFALNNYIYQEKQEPNPTPITIRPSDEEAELTAFGFIQNVINSQPDNNNAASKDAYKSLSIKAKTTIRLESVHEDLLDFIDIESIPEQGASVEDLITTPTSATLIAGLNYSTGRILKAIHMVIENNQWKVDKIENLDTYPPDE